MTQPQTAGQIRLENVRFTFVQSLFDAKQVQGQGEAKFSCTGLLPRDHPQLPVITALVTETARAKWGDAPTDAGMQADGVTKIVLPAFQAVLQALKAQDRLPLHDGNAKIQYEGYAGNYFINASNKMRPLVIGPSREVLTVSDGKPYSGSYGNMIVQFWAQDNKFGKRINASLLGVQFVKDGPRLSGGGVAAADDFEPIPQAGVEAAQAGAGAASLF